MATTNPLVQKTEEGFVEIVTQIKSKTAPIGNVLNLTTSAKGTLVDAVNEVNGIAKAASGGGPATPINDTTPSTTSVYSSSKTEDRINTVATAKAEETFTRVSGGAPEAFDSFKEFSDYVAADKTGAAAMTASINEKVSFNSAQTLTAAQQLQARSNIGAVASADIGDIQNVDFVSVIRTAMAAS
jgi:hypothetical protein